MKDSQGWPTTSPSRGWGGGTLALGSLHILHKVSHSLHTVWTQVWTHVAPGGWQGTLTSCIMARTPVNCDTHHLAHRFSFCQLFSITISSRVHVDQLNYRDGPSKGSLGECPNQIIVCSIKRSLIALLPFGREEKSHSKVSGCDQRGKFQWFPEDAESSSTCIMYWTQTAFAKYC